MKKLLLTFAACVMLLPLLGQDSAGQYKIVPSKNGRQKIIPIKNIRASFNVGYSGLFDIGVLLGGENCYVGNGLSVSTDIHNFISKDHAWGVKAGYNRLNYIYWSGKTYNYNLFFIGPSFMGRYSKPYATNAWIVDAALVFAVRTNTETIGPRHISTAIGGGFNVGGGYEFEITEELSLAIKLTLNN